MKKIFIIIIALAILVWLIFSLTRKQEQSFVNNFFECINAGNLLMESYPRQCRTKDGRLFVENIGNELKKLDLIKISNPRPNQVITSPLAIEGQARGYWFFEADFPVRLFDANDQEIGLAIAQAQGDWMTEDFVPFKAELTFDQPGTDRGYLILEKDNPSGLPENADQLIVPVFFR
ncbi:MAG TPA: Gmad2 immunoglobulin-like domain-containing protein [Patescibacteria group bacterium]